MLLVCLSMHMRQTSIICIHSSTLRRSNSRFSIVCFFFQAEDGIRDHCVTGVQTCALPIYMLGVVIYDRQGALVAATPDLAKTLTITPAPVTEAITQGHGESSFLRLGRVPIHILALPIRRQDEVLGGLAVVHDVSYIRAQILLAWRQTFFRVLAQGFLIVLITLLIVRWSIAGPIARPALWMRGLRTGKISVRQGVPDLDMFRPLARQVSTVP